MRATRRAFLIGTVGLAVTHQLIGSDGLGQSEASSNPESSSGPKFGSGYFGTWIEDEFGLPAAWQTLARRWIPSRICSGVALEKFRRMNR